MNTGRLLSLLPSLLSSLALAAYVFGAAPGFAQELDTSKLPRTGSAKPVYASPLSTIYNTSEPVAAAAETVKGQLAAQGWKPYSDPFSQAANVPSQSIANFKKGSQAVTVFIRTTPPPSNATSVTYNRIPLANDLPFPDDATDIGFAPDRPHLQLRTARGTEAMLAYFRKEMTARGYALWSRKDEARQQGGPDGEIHDKNAHAYYVQDGKRPLLLTLQQQDGGGLRVELKTIPQQLLVAQKEKPPEPSITPPQRRQHDSTADDMAREIERAMRGAIGDALKPPPRPQMAAPLGAPQAPSETLRPETLRPETLRPMAASPAPIPVPEAALDLEVGSGSLRFGSTASVASVAAFYREQMRAQGWQERSTPINRPNMVTLDFRKDSRQVSLTVMQMGPKVNVTGNGSGLTVAAKSDVAKPAARPQQSATLAPPSPAASAPQPLDGEEMGGLPVPSRSTSKGTERTPFRIVLNAEVPADLDSVLAFYRRELGKRNWTEDKQGSAVQPERVALAYTSPEGPAALKLERKAGSTVVELSLRKPAVAEKAGLLPKPGQSKLMFGNMLDKEAVIVIDKRSVKIGAGVGASKEPNGPKLDLAPGKYRYTLRVAGQPPQSDDVEIGAGETWGLLVGPGGVLALQAY